MVKLNLVDNSTQEDGDVYINPLQVQSAKSVGGTTCVAMADNRNHFVKESPATVAAAVKTELQALMRNAYR